MPAIARTTKKGIPVVIASQTLYGRVHPYVYTNLRELSIKLQTIFVQDMLPEVAYVKLQYAIAQNKNCWRNNGEGTAAELLGMIPIDDLINKIKWDEREDPEEYVIVYQDLHEEKEMPYTDIDHLEGNTMVLKTGTEIPLHRIKKVIKQEKVIWQRDSRQA